MNGMKVAKNNMYGEKKAVIVEVEPIKKEPLEMGFEQRLLEEVKAAVFLAKQFPRDEREAEKKILELCKREKFAETALYSVPRSGENTVGPTIRFAEAVARAWGNIQYSVIELETENGVSKMLAYAWDVENNTKSTKQFDVTMQRYTKFGNKNLVSYQECYEMRASYGARFLRGCILNLIPNDIIEEAIEQINDTLNKNISDIDEAKIKAVNFWHNNYGITQAELENYLNLPFADWKEKEISNLRFAYNALKEGQAKIDDLFRARTVPKMVVEKISDEQINRLFELDKGKNKLFPLMQKLYRKNFIGSLTTIEYAELEKLIK